MVVNKPWKELWEALKNDPLYHLEGFCERCIEELKPDTPAEYQYLDGIEGPQARLLHLLCDLGDLARLDNGGGKRDDAERFQYQDDWDYALFSAFVGSPLFMVDCDALKDFLRAKQLPLPYAPFSLEPDSTGRIVELYTEKCGEHPRYLDNVRELLESDLVKRAAIENATGSIDETPEKMAERLREKYSQCTKEERFGRIAKELDEAFPCQSGCEKNPPISDMKMGKLVSFPAEGPLSREGYRSRGKRARKLAGQV